MAVGGRLFGTIEMVAALVGFLMACLVMAALLHLAVKVLAAWHRLLDRLRGEPETQPIRRSRQATGNIIYYRTRNGRSVYKFRIEWTGEGGYRVYVLRQPNYRSRDTANHATHRLSDSRGRYICWAGRLGSTEQARHVAALWADKTEDYILHGRSF